MSVADDIVANIRAGHEIFLAGVQAADENSPSARKLARLIEVAERCLLYPMPLTTWRELVAALEEARKP